MPQIEDEGINGHEYQFEEEGPGRGQPAHRKRLEQLLEFHRKRADAIRLTLSLLDEAMGPDRVRRVKGTLAQAIQLDQERRGKSGKKDNTRATQQAKRFETAALLNSLSKTAPTRLGHIAGILARKGYIARKGDGWVRTSRVFDPTAPYPSEINRKPENKKYRTPTTTKQRRLQTAKMLAKLSTTVPTPNYKVLNRGALAVLQLHGYIEKKGDGYVRTGKEFVVEP